MRKAFIIGIAIGLLACEASSGTPGAGSAAPAGGKATTALTRAQLDEAYKLTDPDKYEASVAAATGKLGKPTKSDADSSTWFGVEGTSCHKLLLTKTKGNQMGTTVPADCGLK
jgi:hypothetical protein